MTNLHNARQNGFTLIEVLVALAILSIALLAALRAAGQATNNVHALRERLLASWVAENRLAEHQARSDWLATGTTHGNESEGNIQFNWQEKIISTPNSAFRRIDVFVYAAPDETQVLAHLTSFVINPPGNK